MLPNGMMLLPNGMVVMGNGLIMQPGVNGMMMPTGMMLTPQGPVQVTPEQMQMMLSGAQPGAQPTQPEPQPAAQPTQPSPEAQRFRTGSVLAATQQNPAISPSPDQLAQQQQQQQQQVGAGQPAGGPIGHSPSVSTPNLAATGGASKSTSIPRDLTETDLFRLRKLKFVFANHRPGMAAILGEPSPAAT